MTEKRFNFVGGYLYDGNKPIGHIEDVKFRQDYEDIVNALHEENEQLKQQIKDCKTYNATLYANNTKSDRMLVNDIKELKEIGDYQAKRIDELNEENRKLEEQLRNLRRLSNELYMEGSE